MSLDKVYKDLEEGLKKTLEHLKDEYAGLQIGRASSAMVERIQVEAYGSMQPLKNSANISVPDAKTIQIQPWDRGLLQAIEKAIKISDLGLMPNNDGVVIRLNVPPLTEERRRDLTKVVGKMAEEAKIAIRNLRHEAMESCKKMEKDSLISEDERKGAEKKIQEKVDTFNKEVEGVSKAKEKDILTI